MYSMEAEKQTVNHESNKNVLLRESSTTSEKDDINGSVIQEQYIPHELLLKIFCYLHPKELIVCHLVCKKWNELIKEYVWKKKAEFISGQSFHFKEEINWVCYYLLCEKAFNRNLLLSDKVDVNCHGAHRMIEFDKNENPLPINAMPFPEDLVVNGKIRCFMSPEYTKYLPSRRLYVIDLLKEGFTEKILDDIQPIIKANIWYCCETCEWNDLEITEFVCDLELLGEKLDNNGVAKEYLMRDSRFDKSFKHPDQRGRWFQHTAEFKNYGKGLRKIIFAHNGRYYAISGGASVKLFLPDLETTSNKIKFSALRPESANFLATARI